MIILKKREKAMKPSTKTLIALLLIAASTLATSQVQCQTQTINDAQNMAYSAYNAILNANQAGAQTESLTEQFNQAVNYTAQAQNIIQTNPQQAETLANQAKELLQQVTQQANTLQQQAQNYVPVIPIATAASIIVIAIIIYRLGPKTYWKTWIKIRGKNKVKTAKNPEKKGAIYATAEQLFAIVLAVMILVAFLSVSNFILPKNTGEQFSELGVLGPNMQLGDYPSVVVATETINLYGYIGNHMNQPIYYTFMVKTGDNNTQINPSPKQPTQQYSQLLEHNQTWTFPIQITMTEPGNNQRIIFELWIYNQTLNQNIYHERWGQLWLNVTAPAR